MPVITRQRRGCGGPVHLMFGTSVEHQVCSVPKPSAARCIWLRARPALRLQAIRQAQAEVRKCVPEGVSLAGGTLS